jgi:acetylornithine deacetylase/succinyl-diaminopimelate desuccinylase-like protein
MLPETRPAVLVATDPWIAVRVAGCLNTSTLSASIAVYRPQADFSGGRFDGKFAVASVEVSLFLVLRGAGDNRVGVTKGLSAPAPVVVTVGSIRGGSVANIIPDEVKMLLSVRSFDPKSRAQTLASIRRQFNGEAAAAGAAESPTITVRPAVDPVYNDPATTLRLAEAIRRALGAEHAVEMPAKMTSEDFSV